MSPAPPIRVGTSGWSYPEWRQDFFAGVPQRRWLAHTAEHFTGVEVNATFYRFMKPETFAKWRDETPPGFAFAIKGHRLITHRRGLRNVSEPLADMRANARPLGDKLEAVLWQLPAALEQDLGLLRNFAVALRSWPEVRHAVEFRHRSWFRNETAEVLESEGLANVLSDAAKWPMWGQVTAGFAYARLHGRRRTYESEYGARGLKPWARRIETWREDGCRVHVYFDNDIGGAAPRDAARLMAMLGVHT